MSLQHLCDNHGTHRAVGSAPALGETILEELQQGFFETFIGTVCLFSRLFILQPLKTLGPVAESFGATGTNWDGSAESECSDLAEV